MYLHHDSCMIHRNANRHDPKQFDISLLPRHVSPSHATSTRHNRLTHSPHLRTSRVRARTHARTHAPSRTPTAAGSPIPSTQRPLTRHVANPGEVHAARSSLSHSEPLPLLSSWDWVTRSSPRAAPATSPAHIALGLLAIPYWGP